LKQAVDAGQLIFAFHVFVFVDNLQVAGGEGRDRKAIIVLSLTTAE
jgi:hypothetical protein